MVEAGEKSESEKEFFATVNYVRVLGMAIDFIDQYQIGEQFELSPGQLDLFSAYFSGYRILKENQEMVYQSRMAETAGMERYPIIGGLVRFAKEKIEEIDEEGRRFIKLGDLMAEFMRTRSLASYADFLRATGRDEDYGKNFRF